MWRTCSLLVLVASCGEVHDQLADAPRGLDSPAHDGPSADGAGATWTAPVKIAPLSTPGFGEWGPTVRADLLEMYFASDRANQGTFDDIYVSTRPNVNSAWGTPTIVPQLSTAVPDLQPSISADGLTIYVTAFNGSSFDIYKSTRATLTTAWITPAIASELNSTADDAPENLSPNNLSILFTSNRNAATGYDLYTATRAAASQPFSGVTPITTVNTSANEFDGLLSDDGLTLYFSSDGGVQGSLDLFVTTRMTSASAFGAPMALTTLNSTALDEDMWVSPDQHLMIFSSSRDGSRDLWQSTR